MTRALSQGKIDAPEEEFDLAGLSTIKFSLVVFGTCVLSFIGGFLNGQSLSGVYRWTVTHLTGASTHLGVTLVLGPWSDTEGVNATKSTLFFFGQVMAFFWGSLFACIILGRHRSNWGFLQTAVLGVELVLLWLNPLLYHQALGKFGYYKILSSHMISTACGLQNALTSNMTFITIRTTNVTGTVVDIGSAFGLCIRDGWGRHFWRVALWVPAYFSFVCGVMMGTLAWKMIDDCGLKDFYTKATAGIQTNAFDDCKFKEDKFAPAAPLPALVQNDYWRKATVLWIPPVMITCVFFVSLGFSVWKHLKNRNHHHDDDPYGGTQLAENWMEDGEPQ